jgi:hypothetical protein
LAAVIVKIGLQTKYSGSARGSSHLKLSVAITLPLIPSHQGRGEKIDQPSPLVGEGWGEEDYKIKCEGPSDVFIHPVLI